MKSSIAAVLLLSSSLLAGALTSAHAQTRICSGLTPQNWRTVMPVPANWNKEDCRAFVGSIAGQTVQLGCLFDYAPTPNLPKFSWGSGAPVGTSPTTAAAPQPNCGW